MYEDSLLEMQYEDRFYVEDDLDDELLEDDDDPCVDGCDPMNLRFYSSDEDQCIECGRIEYV